MNILIYDRDCRSSGIDYPLASAFEKMGHQTYMFDWGKFLFTANNISLINRIKDRFFFDFVAYQINQSLLSLIKRGNFDLFLVVRGDHIYPETIAKSKMFLPAVVNWNSDDLFNKLNTTKHILNSFKLYDIHFSSRSHLKDDYISKGAKRFETLDWYYRLGLLSDRNQISKNGYQDDISFIGSWSKRRLSFLEHLKDQQLKVCGWGWKKKLNLSEFNNWSFSNSVRMTEMMTIFARSKININLLTTENRDVSNHRNFEIPAAGGFQMSEWSEQIVELFKEDSEIVCFKDKEELADKCRFYLKNDSLRQRILLAGYDRLISSNYSLESRLQQVLNSIK